LREQWGHFVELGSSAGVSGIRGKSNSHMIEVRPCTPPVAVTGVPSYNYSTNIVTLDVVNTWTIGQQILIAGMFPAEYNGLQTLTAAAAPEVRPPISSI
jgi:hypothetical protein